MKSRGLASSHVTLSSLSYRQADFFGGFIFGFFFLKETKSSIPMTNQKFGVCTGISSNDSFDHRTGMLGKTIRD